MAFLIPSIHVFLDLFLLFLWRENQSWTCFENLISITLCTWWPYQTSCLRYMASIIVASILIWLIISSFCIFLCARYLSQTNAVHLCSFGNHWIHSMSVFMFLRHATFNDGNINVELLHVLLFACSIKTVQASYSPSYLYNTRLLFVPNAYKNMHCFKRFFFLKILQL